MNARPWPQVAEYRLNVGIAEEWDSTEGHNGIVAAKMEAARQSIWDIMSSDMWLGYWTDHAH
jgi:hypothetical protein